MTWGCEGLFSECFLAHPDNDLGPESSKDVYENGLVFLYRLLFVLNAEARDLLPTERRNPEARRYVDRYGLEAVREKPSAATNTGTRTPRASTPA